MIKYILIALTFMAISHTPIFAADHFEGTRLFVDPPDIPYKELGMIEDQEPISDTENNIFMTIGSRLKNKTTELGGDAFFVKTISRIPVVYKKHVNYSLDPFLFKEHLTIRMKVEAMAIKLNP